MKWYLGTIKNSDAKVYLEDFKWESDWYWSGGHIEVYENNIRRMHTHFNSCFLEREFLTHLFSGFGPNIFHHGTIADEREGITYHKIEQSPMWEDLSFFMDNPPYNKSEWWKIKSVFDSFYKIKKVAECFHSGSRLSHIPEIENKDIAAQMNEQIKTVIIPKAHKLLNKEN